MAAPMPRPIVLFLTLAAALWCARPACAGEKVDLCLVLASDVSRSVDAGEFQLQRQGYAQAFRDRRVLQAIRSGVLGRIAVAYLEWSGEDFQKVVVEWTAIGDEESAGLLADKLQREPRSFANRTAIGAAIDHAAALLANGPFDAERKVIDIAGDGTNTNGKLPMTARDEAVKSGLAVNALVILSPEPMPWNPYHTHPPGGLPKYFEENVIGGPGAFLTVAEGYESFAEAILAKLVKEIAAAPAARGTLAELPR